MREEDVFPVTHSVEIAGTKRKVLSSETLLFSLCYGFWFVNFTMYFSKLCSHSTHSAFPYHFLYEGVGALDMAFHDAIKGTRSK